MRILGRFGLIAGATYPLRALRMFKRTPRLWSYLIIPILVNIILGGTVYAGLLYLGWQGIEGLSLNLVAWVSNAIANLPPWLGFLSYLVFGIDFFLRVLLIFVLFLLTGFIFAQFGVLLGSPWYGKLSEQLEALRLGQITTIEVGLVQDIWRAIVFELKKLGLAIAIGVPLFLLQVIPGIGTIIASLGGILLTATLTSLDFLDAPSERRRFSFRKKLRLVFQSLPASGSFALVCLGLVSIPLLNLVTIPICVASGTLFWCDRILPKLSPGQGRNPHPREGFRN